MAARFPDLPTPRRRMLAALLVLATVPLAACQGNRAVTGSIGPQAAHSMEEVALDLHAGPQGLTPDSRAAARDFIAAYGHEGAGPLHVHAPGGGAGGGGGYHAVGEIRQMVRRSGIPDGAVAYDAYHTKPGSAPLTLSYQRQVAAVGCGQWPSNLAGDWRNLPYENFGCATAQNLAVMVEDPRDLQGPRATGPRDAQRRDTVFERYRAGQATAGASATDQAGGASDVGN